MRFKQYEDGSCDIEFSEEEINIINKNSKLKLSSEHLRHFGNHLVKIVSDWNLKFNKDIANLDTKMDTIIEGK